MMKFKILATSIAAAVGVLAVSSARAQQVTNVVTFSAKVSNQGPTNDVNGITTYGPTKTSSVNNALLLQEIGGVLTGGGSLSPAAKLVLISTSSGAPTFAVIDGATFYDLSSNPGGANLMNISNIVNFQIKSGKQSDSTVQKSTTESLPIAVVYDDTGSGGNLQFTLFGLASVTEIRTTPVNNIYTDTVKGKISSMTGGGAFRGSPFVATGTISFAGRATLQLPP